MLSSDLVRATETARIALGDALAARMHVDPRLRERSCGAWERREIGELERSGDMMRLREFDGRPPGGESLRDVALRALAALSPFDDGTHTAVVCHGALMRAVIGAIDGVAITEIGLWKPDNCEVVIRSLPIGRPAAIASSLE